jgi:dihydrofolate reductase
MELIVACDKNGVIGKNGQVPWNVPEDMKWFMTVTQGSVVIMGRKTYESLPMGGLKGRVNIVLTNNKKIEGVITATMDNLMEIVEKYRGDRKVFVIGGGEVYKLLLDKCNILHITVINMEVEGGDSWIGFDIKQLVNNGEFKVIRDGGVLQSKVDNIEYQIITYERC